MAEKKDSYLHPILFWGGGGGLHQLKTPVELNDYCTRKKRVHLLIISVKSVFCSARMIMNHIIDVNIWEPSLADGQAKWIKKQMGDSVVGR